jgi:hypothetical protein
VAVQAQEPHHCQRADAFGTFSSRTAGRYLVARRR